MRSDYALKCFVLLPLPTILQKLDYMKTLDWRKERSKCNQKRTTKKANLVKTLTEDALRLQNDSLQCRTFLPAKVTKDGEGAFKCCSVSFCKLYGCSTKTKVKYWELIKHGTEIEMEEAQELKSGKNEGRRQQTLLWMKNTFHLLCDILPTSDYSAKNYHLPKCMTKQALHHEYWTEHKALQETSGAGDKSEFKPYSRSTFAKLWLSNFDYVQIPEHMAFSVCEHCSTLHDRLLTATKQRDRVLMKQIGDLRKMHLRFVGNERLVYREHQRLARDHPDEHVCLCIDGMDQAKLRGPHFAGGGLPKSSLKNV